MPGFLDRIREEIDRGVVQIGTRSRQLLESTQIRSQIRLLQNRRAEGIAELGQVVYQMARQGIIHHSRLAPYVSTLEQIDQQVAVLEEQLRKGQETAEAALRAARAGAPAFAYCTCGEALKETSKFCPRCGQDVREIVQRAAATRAAAPSLTPGLCPACGTAVGATAKFCPVCGQPLAQGG